LGLRISGTRRTDAFEKGWRRIDTGLYESLVFSAGGREKPIELASFDESNRCFADQNLDQAIT